MLSKKIKHKRFIEQYENNIKKYRDEYYKNIIINNKNNSFSYPSLAVFLLPIIISIFVIIKQDFSISSFIISIIIILISNIIISIINRIFNVQKRATYKSEIKKLGFFSIDDYEKKLKKYVTGPTGYYSLLLNEMMNEYNITENTRKIYCSNGEEYYIWTNNDQNQINLLTSKTTSKPEIKTIKIANIRYYRVDNLRKEIILKTDTTEYDLKLESLNVLNELIVQKRLENIHRFTAEEYINDFELYMHTIKSDIQKQKEKTEQNRNKHITLAIISLIVIILLIGSTCILEDYIKIINITIILVIMLLNKELQNIFSLSNKIPKTENDYIIYLNENKDIVNNFEELKYSLGISNNFDKVYTKENACYLTWISNGYFHVFLNMVYFNVVYMSIKAADVEYYKIEKNECQIKLKDKTLSFKKEAKAVFDKILPNKDYEWIKGYQIQK